MSENENFEDMGENVGIISLPHIKDGQPAVNFTAIKFERADKDLFSEFYKVLLYSFNEESRMILTDEFEAKFIDGKPYKYVENLALCGIYAAVINKNSKNFEEDIKIAKKIFQIYE